MGAKPWHYFVPYEQDVNFTLQKLREREFKGKVLSIHNLAVETAATQAKPACAGLNN